jgi:hypothetical protein
MTPEELQEQIEKLESEIARTAKQLESHAQEFVQMAAPRAQEWVSQLVERIVTSLPDTSKQLGSAGLTMVKAEVAKFKASVPELVKQQVGSNTLWIHRATPSPQGTDSFAYSPQWPEGGDDRSEFGVKAIHRALKGIASGVASVMTRQGFDLSGDHSWSDRYIGNRSFPFYRGELKWSDEMVAVMKKYHELIGPYLGTINTLEDTKRQKASAEAKRLWDEA